MQYPSFARANVTHLELVALEPSRLLVILVTDTGRVSQRIATVPVLLEDADVALLRAQLATLVTGRSVGAGSERIAAMLAAPAEPANRLDGCVRELARVIGDELEEFRQNRLVMAGAATLAKREQDFRGSIHPLLEAIEEQVTLLRLLSEMQADDHGLAASIGRENDAFGLGDASIVASDYDSRIGTARIGVMGPTRMDYPSNLSAARAVARYLTRLLHEDASRR